MLNNYQEIKSDLIKLALDGAFEVIAHGCNCFCVMGAGIALKFKNTFEVSKLPLENIMKRGDINKLGNIEYINLLISTEKKEVYTQDFISVLRATNQSFFGITVVNAYTQYKLKGNKNLFIYENVDCVLDYEALALCLRKMNNIFKGKTIGLPQIGCNLAGGDWNKVKEIIQRELKDCYVTVVLY